MTRHQIQLLVDQGGMQLPMTGWPLPSAAVRRALADLPAALPGAVLENARAAVLAALDRAAGAEAFVTVRGGKEGPSGFGDEASAGSAVGLRGNAFALGPAVGQFGLRADAGEGQRKRIRLDDSAVALERYGIQLQAFARRTWWGPGWQSSAALSDNAPPYLGVSVQRALATRSDDWWLSWAGPWTAEIFFARGDHAEETVVPTLIGNRITFRPTARLEVGLTRMIQWGGAGRPGSVSSLFNVLIGNKTNVEVQSLSQDEANELAGIDLRYSCGTSVRCAFYTQIIGEDRGKLAVPKKTFGLFGAETWTADGRHRFYAEYTDTMCQRLISNGSIPNCVYRNGAYPGGYTSGGRWLGASVGPDSRLLTVGWLDAAQEQLLRLHVGYVGSQIASFAPFVYSPSPDTSGHMLGASARRIFKYGRINVTPEAAVTRINSPNGHGQTDVRIGLSVNVPL